MRVAVIVVAIVMVATPSHASKSCMTMAEARQQFRTSHLYWHGAGHCWDATAPLHGIVHRSRERDREPAGPDNPASKNSTPKWRDALSEMLPDDGGSQVTTAQITPSWSYDATEAPARRMNWLDRWVDVAQVTPAIVASGKAEAAGATDVLLATRRRVDPLITPTRLLMAFLAFAMMLAIIELLQGTKFDRRG
jgi:hypothetical protein